MNVKGGQSEGGSTGEGRGKEWTLRGKKPEKCYMYIFEDNITKPTKLCKEKGWGGGKREREYDGRHEFVQSTLGTCMGLPQRNSHVPLEYMNSKYKNKYITRLGKMGKATRTT
jgi:hypothetical protein